MAESDTVTLMITSYRNISFKETIDTHVPREEWSEMSAKDQDDAIRDAIFDSNVIEVTINE